VSAKIISINISPKKGMRKKTVDSAVLKDNYGIENDAHGIREMAQAGEPPRYRKHKENAGQGAQGRTPVTLRKTSQPRGSICPCFLLGQR